MQPSIMQDGNSVCRQQSASSSHLTAIPPFKQVAHDAFYKPPVQLGTEPANMFLGDPKECSLTHHNNITTADIIHPHSATATQTLRSSFQARARRVQQSERASEPCLSGRPLQPSAKCIAQPDTPLLSDKRDHNRATMLMCLYIA